MGTHSLTLHTVGIAFALPRTRLSSHTQVLPASYATGTDTTADRLSNWAVPPPDTPRQRRDERMNLESDRAVA